MNTSKLKQLSVPAIATIAVTRGVIGFGAGLLVADKFPRERRNALGWALLVSGLVSTIPIAMYVFRKGTSTQA
jgi:hypothetical protein